MIEQLNALHAIDGHIRFSQGRGGLPMATIANGQATAEIYLHGAHVTHYQPNGQAPILWMSSQALYQPDKALRGGIPVIWPWFGPHPTDDTKPQHGFARVSPWAVIATEISNDEATGAENTILRLGLTDSDETRAVWPNPFELELAVTVDTNLQVDLTCHNTGPRQFETGAALHTYFNVGNIDKVHVEGLDSRNYLDKVTGYDRKNQKGPIHFTSEVDRIYIETSDQVNIHDAALGRQINVTKSGSQSTVVWNPWAEKAAAMGDYPDDGYQTMVCVETTNAANDVRVIAPNESHTLTQRIAVG